jgi:hypothetical protein
MTGIASPSFYQGITLMKEQRLSQDEESEVNDSSCIEKKLPKTACGDFLNAEPP